MKSNTAITLYNKYIDPATRSEKYQRVVIADVYWENRKGINRARGGDIADDTAMIVIPMARGANYLKPAAWQALTTKTGKWTIQPGDVMVRGSVTDEISSSFTITALSKKYDDVVTVTSVDDFYTGTAQHWEVSAK